jgi:uncharacterized membrane protein
MSESSDDGGRSDATAEPGLLPRDPVQRTLTIVLLVLLAASLTGVVYVAANPPETTDPYTEFYVLGPGGNATDYPTNLTVGERGRFVVGLTNHEHDTQRYHLEANLSEQTVLDRSVTVDDEATWESNVSFSPESTGEHRLQLRLYKDQRASADPDQTLRLWVRVHDTG